jgi:hypothetical protein
MIDTSREGRFQELLQPESEILGIGWGRGLVMNGCSLRIRQGTSDNRINETRFVWAEDPGNAHHAMQGACGKHRSIPSQLAFSIVAERPWFILLGVGAVECSVKNIVGTDMHKPGTPRCTESGKAFRRLEVDPESCFQIAFAAVDIGSSSAVDHHITGTKTLGGKPCLSGIGIGKIDLGAGQGDHLGNLREGLPATEKCRTETTIGTKDENFHREKDEG